MDRRFDAHTKNAMSLEYQLGVIEFIKFAKQSMTSDGTIRCPCIKCKNMEFKLPNECQLHLYKYGIVAGYKVWTAHGELPAQQPMQNTGNDVSGDDEDMFDALDMINELAGAEFDNLTESGEGDRIEQEPNGGASQFYKMMQDATTPLYPGANVKNSKLSFVSKLLYFKNTYGCSEHGFDELLTFIGEALPSDHVLPKSYYEVKNIVKGLNLGYKKIDACVNDCMLFYGDNSLKNHCDVCQMSRYKVKACRNQRDIPRKILRYFPLAPRLQRLFMSSHTAKHMRWHCNREKSLDKLTHPADGDEWRKFDRNFPGFSKETRNVRLGLATDGFCPFTSASSRMYSIWPVIMVVYNLPPSMCMKEPYMFMSLLIPGEKSPTKDINVYLRPLIDELNMLWINGVETYDRSLKENFTMKAALLWTINDFPAYGMLSGWSTHGRLSCPVCTSDVQGFTLKHGGKCSFFGTSRYFLDEKDPLRKPRLFGSAERRSVVARSKGSRLKSWVEQLEMPPPGKSQPSKWRATGFGRNHNFTHRTIFFDLPYWGTLTLRHCIDVMHTEKNVFDNIFYTVLDDAARTKDNRNARLDLQEMKIRPELWITPEGTKPKAKYTLTRAQVKLVCEWVHNLKFPDNFASNISRCSKVEQLKFQGMKTHDCHIFMQKLMPIAFKDLLPADVVEALTEVSNFFKDLCSTVLLRSDLDKMQKDIVRTLCKLELIFPPAFFDSMEHLIIHLVEEARLGGPVQWRWMYPFERDMRRKKLQVKNKARAEGSIAEKFVEVEIVHTTSSFFGPSVSTVHSRLGRNETERRPTDPNLLEAFRYPVDTLGHAEFKYLTSEEMKIAGEYVLMNMPEVQDYIR